MKPCFKISGLKKYIVFDVLLLAIYIFVKYLLWSLKKKNVNPWPKFNSMIYFVLGEYCSPFILKSKHVSKIYMKSCKMTWPSIGGLRAKHELASQYHHSLLFWKWICAIMHILGLFFLIYKLKLVFFFYII